jgi:Holliday junction resolvase
MSNPNKRKGDQFERDVVAALQAYGVDAYRTLSAGIPADAGDVHAGRDWTLSCKNRTAWDHVASWADAVEPMVAASHRVRGALVMKRRMAHVGEAYVILSLWELATLIREAEA